MATDASKLTSDRDAQQNKPNKTRATGPSTRRERK